MSKKSPGATLFVTILSFEIRHKHRTCKDLREFETCSVSFERSKPVRYFLLPSDSLRVEKFDLSDEIRKVMLTESAGLSILNGVA
ncbi:MAG: hypothetical protein ACK56W_02885 [Pirellula sp.]|jgi:hypothetical protein|nr:hypothetical protein [Pirellula sp.]